MTTSKLSTYSTTAASNNSAAPNGWPEGMLPSDVNNCAREGMARVREWYEDAQWINFGHTIVSSTGTTIVVSGDQTAIYSTYRAIRVNQSASQDGWVTSSTYSAPNTTITVNGFTVSSPTLVEVGAITSATSLPQNMEMVIYSATFNGPVTAATITASVLNATTLGSVATGSFGALTAGTLTVTTLNASGGSITCATQAQMETPSATSIPVSPAGVKYHPGVAKWFVHYTDAGGIQSSHNVASVTSGILSGTEWQYVITLTTAMSAATHAPIAIPIRSAQSTYGHYIVSITSSVITISTPRPDYLGIIAFGMGDFA